MGDGPFEPDGLVGLMAISLRVYVGVNIPFKLLSS